MPEQLPTPEQPQALHFNKLTWKISLGLLISAFIIYPKPFLKFFNPFIQRFRKFYQTTRPALTTIVFSIDNNLQGNRLIKSKVFKVQQANVIVINLFERQIEERLIGKRAYHKNKNHHSPSNKSQYLIFGAKSEVNTHHNNHHNNHHNSQNQQNQLISQLWSQNIVHEIRILNLQAKYMQNSNIAILVKGRSQILKKIQAKLYKLKTGDEYKIPNFEDYQQIHIMQRNQHVQSYQHQIMRIDVMKQQQQV